MRRFKPGGFTLIETIFSTLFIGIAVLAIVNLFPSAYLSIKKSEIQIQSDILARSILDDLRTKSFDKLAEGRFTPPPPDDNDELYLPHEVDGTIYYPKVEIYQVDSAQFDVIKGIRVTIEYRQDSNERSLFPFPPPYVEETYLLQQAMR